MLLFAPFILLVSVWVRIEQIHLTTFDIVHVPNKSFKSERTHDSLMEYTYFTFTSSEKS